MKNQKILAFAQLLRLPNVFTAFADIGMACAATGALANYPIACLLAALASGFLYLSGMVWNDIFDRAEDAQVRTFRPIPSGRVRLRTAIWLAIGLMLAGGISVVALGYVDAPATGAWIAPPLVAAVLAVAILLYDGWLKHTPVGPVGMGMCRFLNVLLGLSIGDLSHFPDVLLVHLPAIVGIYIVGVTWFARTEEGESQRGQLIAAASVMALAGGLALAVPIHRATGATLWAFPYLLVAWGFFVGIPLVHAIRIPTPKRVQAAVKRSIFGLVILDAVVATAFVGWWGLLLALLLLPAIWLGRRVYST